LAKERLRENNFTTYITGKGNQSSIARTGFLSRLTSWWGWRPNSEKGKSSNSIAGKYGIDMVRVDLDNMSQRGSDARLGELFSKSPFSDKLGKLFDAWLRDSTNGYDDLRDRQKRINELKFMYYNDPFISRVTQLAPDEATQLTIQDRLISVESPNPVFVDRIYELFDLWGITQSRVHGAFFDLELFGEAFWAQKVTSRGVEKIIPLQVNQILERLEFNPTKVAEIIRLRQGSVMNAINRDQKMALLLDQFEAINNAEDFAEMFETKLFGFVVDNDTVIPPWAVTHFRNDADHSEFYPYGRPHLLACLAPFKQAASTMTLQSIARILSFPVTLYKVKTAPGQSEAEVWSHVNKTREQYDNIGVSPTAGSGEAFSVNTKMWLPDGLLEVEIAKSEADIDFVADLEMYIDRIAIASGIPKGYLVQEWGGFGNSAVSLVEQWKPFATHVHTLQSNFLDGLGSLIRLHMAITGEFDFTTPFSLAMRFPAEEASDEKQQARSATLDMAQKIIDVIGTSMGVEEGEPLPPDVVKDILAKYTFLNPTDVLKWTQKVSMSVLAQKAKATSDEGSAEQGSAAAKGGETLDLDFGGFGEGGGGEAAPEEEGSEGGEAPTPEEGGAETAAPTEESAISQGTIKRLAEQRKQYLARMREQELTERYNKNKQKFYETYFELLTKNRITESTGGGYYRKLISDKPRVEDETYFDTMIKWREADKSGHNPFEKRLTLREELEKMAKEDRIPQGELNFSKLREHLDSPDYFGELFEEE